MSTVTWFRRIFVIKIALSRAVMPLDSGLSAAITVAAVAGVLLSWSGKRSRWGLLLLLPACLGTILPAWPFTINHRMFELLVLVLLFLNSEREDGPFLRKAVLTLIVSVWFYAGIQKIVHGYYATGEWFALQSLAASGDKGGFVGFLLSGVRAISQESLPRIAACCSTRTLSLPTEFLFLFQILGLGTIVAEVGLPLLTLSARTRRAGLLGLLGLQVMIAVSSLELDFAITSTACLGLGLFRGEAT